MGKYLVLWEVDQTRIPVDPKERKDAWSLLMAVVRQDIEKGIGEGIKKGVEEEGKINIAIYTAIETMKSMGVGIDDNATNEIYKELRKKFDGLTREYVAKVVAEYKK